ncbi:MAG: DUF4328 domain-containing protein [Thermocrispum sp.]
MTDAGWLGQQQVPEVSLRGSRYDGTPKRVALIGKVACGLILAVAAAEVLVVVLFWEATGLLEDALSRRVDPAVAYSDFLAVLELADSVDWAYWGSALVAAAVFVLWLWRARQNSDLLSDGLHSRERGWVIGGWFVPIVSFWFPYQVVRDVWRASNPSAGVPRDLGPNGRSMPGSALIGWWWFWFLVASISATVSWRLYSTEPGDTPVAALQWLNTIALADTVSAVAAVLAAACIAMITRQISGWQHALRDQPHDAESAPAS